MYGPLVRPYRGKKKLKKKRKKKKKKKKKKKSNGGGGGGGGLQMRTSALFGAKNFGFFEIYGVSARTRGGGLASADILRTGERVIFRDFLRASFMNGPLPGFLIVCLSHNLGIYYTYVLLSWT